MPVEKKVKDANDLVGLNQDLLLDESVEEK